MVAWTIDCSRRLWWFRTGIAARALATTLATAVMVVTMCRGDDGEKDDDNNWRARTRSHVFQRAARFNAGGISQISTNRASGDRKPLSFECQKFIGHLVVIHGKTAVTCVSISMTFA